jgi:predicted  nucleic acid-binding Zn-ribbon protein
MAREDIVKTVLDLAKTSEELDSVKKDLTELKQQKGQLESNVVVLKRARQDEQEKYDSQKREKDKQIADLNSEISKLQTQRNQLSNSAIPELQRIESLKASVNTQQGELRKQDELNTKREKSFAENYKKVDEKIKIISQIKELADKL